MSMTDKQTIFLTLKLGGPLLTRYQADGPRAVIDDILGILGLSFTPEIRGVPALTFGLAFDDVPRTEEFSGLFVWAISQTQDEIAELHQAFSAKFPRLDVTINADLPIAHADSWCPSQASFPLFLQRDAALRQIAATDLAALGAQGEGVNVVIVDQGINREELALLSPNARFRGGWRICQNPDPETGACDAWTEPGAWPDGHGTRMAETVLAVAPKANILDLPLLPSRIDDLRGYLAWAAYIYGVMPGLIDWLRNRHASFRGPWVFCNAWSVYRLAGDAPFDSAGAAPDPIRSYGRDPKHFLSEAVARLPRDDLGDVLFAAGNCGQFCPDSRCGAGQIGPGRSIYGVAALKEVTTLSAVRADDIWLGYASQGPSPEAFESRKPDIAASSQFARPGDWARGYTGTSTACALAAGAFAAVRSHQPTQSVKPAALRQKAIDTARAPAGAALPDARLGAGILNARRLLLDWPPIA